MSSKIALIVCDEAPRRNLLFNHVKREGLTPVSFPNYGSYHLELKERQPELLIADLSLPLTQKLRILQVALERYPGLRVITIGKRAFIESQGETFQTPNFTRCIDLAELLHAPAISA